VLCSISALLKYKISNDFLMLFMFYSRFILQTLALKYNKYFQFQCFISNVFEWHLVFFAYVYYAPLLLLQYCYCLSECLLLLLQIKCFDYCIIIHQRKQSVTRIALSSFTCRPNVFTKIWLMLGSARTIV